MSQIRDFLDEYLRYQQLGARAIAQTPDDGLNRVVAADLNSIGTIVRHVSGNMKSRFTDFLTSDGEKPWRDRDAEFAHRDWTRVEIEAMWAEGFAVIEREVGALTDADLAKSVTIRGVGLTVHAALTRSTTHVSHHVGQIVFLARMAKGDAWESLSIPRGGSAAYNANPTKEKAKRE
jgi:uncharacterized damage-inducible protein DinB